MRGKEKEAPATMILPIIDGLCQSADPRLDAEIERIRRNLVGDHAVSTVVSLGWSNWQKHKPLKAGHTVTVGIEITDARASKTRPGMAIIDFRKTALNQNSEKFVEVDHLIGIF